MWSFLTRGNSYGQNRVLFLKKRFDLWVEGPISDYKGKRPKTRSRYPECQKLECQYPECQQPECQYPECQKPECQNPECQNPECH